MMESARVEFCKNMDDVRLAKAGNKEAFATLINCHRLTLYKVAKGILESDYDVTDAIQETIILAYTNIGSLKRDEYFKTWLVRILINECKKNLRRSNKTIPFEKISEQAVWDNYPSDSITSNCIMMLELSLRQVTVLYYYEDFSVNEIAKILNIPQGTVKSRLSKARSKILELMAGKGEDK